MLLLATAPAARAAPGEAAPEQAAAAQSAPASLAVEPTAPVDSLGHALLALRAGVFGAPPAALGTGTALGPLIALDHALDDVFGVGALASFAWTSADDPAWSVTHHETWLAPTFTAALHRGRGALFIRASAGPLLVHEGRAPVLADRLDAAALGRSSTAWTLGLAAALGAGARVAPHPTFFVELEVGPRLTVVSQRGDAAQLAWGLALTVGHALGHARTSETDPPREDEAPR